MASCILMRMYWPIYVMFKKLRQKPPLLAVSLFLAIRLNRKKYDIINLLSICDVGLFLFMIDVCKRQRVCSCINKEE